MWCRSLKILHHQCSSLGRCCVTGAIPGWEVSHTPGKKKKKKKRKKMHKEILKDDEYGNGYMGV